MWNIPLGRTLVLVILCASVRNAQSESGNQPRISSNEGNLVIQSAKDKNITLRLSGNSRFMLNQIDVVDSLQKGSIQVSPIDNLGDLSAQLQSVKSTVLRFANRLRRMENRSSLVPNGRFRRLQVRLESLWRRVAEVEEKLKEDDCTPNPCKHGGKCYDLYENFHCECPDAWTGKTCESDVNECYNFGGTDLGCQNKAACVNLPGSYRCVCTNGFIGTHCRERGTDCTNSRPGELCGNGVCIPANNDKGYQCLCDPGWKADNVTQSCTVDVNECLDFLTACHTSCINLPGSYVCGPCPIGYTGNGITCRDIDECATNNGGCSMLPKVQCINTEGSHRCGNCPPGWTGNGQYCSKADSAVCDGLICHPLARCEIISNMQICVCPEGMTGTGYGPAGCRAGSSNPCNEHQCQNGGTCINHGNTYSCICPPGFAQPNCQTQDPCAANPCQNGGTCFRENTSDFKCTCPREFTGRRCETKRNSCGSVIREPSGDLSYPPDGGEYEPNKACAWVIRTDDNLILNVSFSRFDVQSDPECSKDWLQINDGRSLATPLIGRFCGNQFPLGGNILSSHNILFLWFRTDNSTNAAGFSLSWNSVQPICGGRQQVDGQGHGVIKSPGYPGKSPSNRDCEWTIIAPFHKRIQLRFFEVVMDRSINCTKDALIIYDANEVLERVCETGVPAPRYTSSNVAKIHFHTDPYREDSMFQAHFEVVEGKPGCGGLFTEPKGTIQFTTDLVNCIFLIQQPVGTKISISFTKGEASYALLALKAFDGKTDEDPMIAQSFEGIMPDELLSSGNYMLILFTSKGGSNGVAYEAQYERVCGQELRDPAGGTFATPNYPKPYFAALNCKYSIIGPLHSVVHFNITDYDLSEYGETCDDDADYIEFYYSLAGPTVRHCKDGPLHIVSPSSYLFFNFHSSTNVQQRRGISANYRFEEIGCGGILSEANGSIQMWNPVNSRIGYCEWVLEAPYSRVIKLDLTYKRIGAKCSAGEADLRIFVNETGTEGRLVESLCGGGKQLSTTFNSRMVTIFLRTTPPNSVGNAVFYGFRANYSFALGSSTCGGNYSILSGSIQSPGWPNRYFGSMDCVWVIHAPLGHKIELVPKNFSLEEPNRLLCFDYLEIRNGLSAMSPLIGKYCGMNIPQHIPSFTNHLYLHFHSDEALNFPGFDINYQQTSTGCGGTLISSSGSIASPHYPEISRGPVQCDWKIAVSQGSTIDINITSLSQGAGFCSNNILTVYDGVFDQSQILPINCTPTATLFSLKSSKNTVFIRYVLPEIDAAEDQQFYLTYSTDCRQTLDVLQGVIESPNFPNMYPNSLRCEWNIVGRKSETITLTFSHFELEVHDTGCSYDELQIIDMKDEENLRMHKICGNPPEMLTSDGNRLVIKFSSDRSSAGNGFRLEFKRNGCGKYSTASFGFIASPQPPYSVDSNCEWFIEVAPGKQIVLQVFEVNIETEKDDCSTNGLIIKNDRNDVRELLRECRIGKTLASVTSQGNTMYIKFYSDSVRSIKYFKSSYRTREAECGGVFQSNQGEIMSPKYPQNYTRKAYCGWTISVEQSSSVQFTFEAMEIPRSENCSQGFVEVYDGMKTDENSKLIGRYCGEVGRQYVKASGNRISVIFSAEDGPPTRGFLMKYKKSCGKIMTEKEGFLKSFETDRECVWQIQGSDPGEKITINFIKIECHCEGLSDDECHKTRGVKVSSSATSPAILSFCQDHPPDFNSDSNSIFVTATNVSFAARYSTLETACGGLLTSLRGSLTSPYYPQTYPSNVECIWTIVASPGNYLELSLKEMDIFNSDNCNQDYLEIREKESYGRLLGVFCSNSPPTDTLQAFENVWIKFHSSEDSVGKGFKLSWTFAQINEITGFSGAIVSPPIVSVRSEPDPFKWRITVPRDNVIWMAFKVYSQGLKLFDGFDETAMSIEDQPSPWEVTSSTNVIFLISDNQILDRFRIEWKAMPKSSNTRNDTSQDCNSTLIIGNDPFVNLSSPGYPEGYKDNLRCQWLLKADHPSKHVVLVLYDVRLERLERCIADYLEISSSSNLVDWHQELKMCDSPFRRRTPIATIHGTPFLKANFITDATVNKTGFSSLIYTTCGGNLTGPIGRIHDVDIISATNEIRNCTWHLKVTSGRRIKFDFEFPKDAVKNSSNQCENYALIRDGIDDGAPILPPGRICSLIQFNGTVITASNRATVKYFLQSFNPFFPFKNIRNMWNLTYREFSECGGEVGLTSYAPSVNLTSPKYPNVPNPHTECIWKIVAPPGEAIQAVFVDRFDMNSRRCRQEFIEFRDGSTPLSRLLGKYCVRPGTVRSSGNVLYIRYLTDISEPRNGFKVQVSLSTCGGTFTQTSNVITSANYPSLGAYPANSVCDYVIKVTSYARVNLTFVDIDLPFDAGNLNGSDYIKIYDIQQASGVRVEDELAVIYGNTTTMPAMDPGSNEILIRFFSFKANNKFRGFKVRYEKIFGRCFRDVSGESGTLSLNEISRRFSMLMCRWQITVPKGRRVKVEVSATTASPNAINAFRSVRVHFFNDFQMQSPLATNDLKGSVESRPIISSDNKMLIRIFGMPQVPMRGIQFVFTSSEISICPDDITSDSGSISLAIPASTPMSSFYCESNFILNGAQTIAFNISRLILETTLMHTLGFGIRFRNQPFMESRILNSNVTNFNIAMAAKRGSVEMLHSDARKLTTFEATFIKHACGGEYRIGQKFDIDLPNFSPGYGGLDCAWQIMAEINQNGYDLLANFSFALPCEEEFAAVHSGQSAESLLITKLCKGATFNTTRLQTQFLYVIYHTTAYSSESQLHMMLQKAGNCGGNILLEHSELVDFSPEDYKNNLECVWELQALSGFFLRLEFMRRFFIEESKDCVKDYLEIRKYENGVWISLPRYCGRNLPTMVNTTSERLQLIFRSDDSVTGDGFTVNVDNTCNAVFNATTEKQIIRYTSKLPHGMFRYDCVYTLQSDLDKFIQLKFTQLALSHRDSCTLAQLTVEKKNFNGGMVEMGKYCKKGLLPELRAKKFIAVTYQAVIETGGYEFEFWLDECGGKVTEPTWIQSLKGDEGSRYAHNMNCVWNITAPQGHNIVIRFKNFAMESNDECSMDYVAIYSGAQVNLDRRQALLCGNLTANPPSFHIEGDSAVVVAASDYSYSEEGFLAQIIFTKACNKQVNLTSVGEQETLEGIFEVESNEVVFCDSRILGLRGYRIEIEVAEIQLNLENVTCDGQCENCNWLQVVDSVESSSFQLGRYCSPIKTKPKSISSYNNVVIRINIERQGSYRYKVNLKLVEMYCGDQTEFTLTNSDVLKISSRNESNGLYRPNVHCTWLISSQSDFALKFEPFNLQNKSDVTGQCLDYVYVKYTRMGSNSEVEEHCGSVPTHTVYVSKFKGKALAQVTFHTDEQIESTGFTLSAYNRDACSQTMNQTSGMFAGTFSKDVICVNDIDMSDDYTVNIVVIGLFFRDTNCSKNYVKVYDKKTGEIIAFDCSDGSDGRRYFTSTSQVRIELQLNRDKMMEIAFFGSLKSLPPGCGGNINLGSGYLISPNYQEYRNASVCIWTFTTNALNQFDLNFAEFNMGTICKFDYLEIIDFADNGEEIVSRRYCEQNNIRAFRSKSNRVSIKSVTTADFDGTGWKLFFSSFASSSIRNIDMNF